MPLYLVVHHPDAPPGNFTNVFEGDSQLISITTFERVKTCCETARDEGRNTYIYRTSLNLQNPRLYIRATICCKVKIEEISDLHTGLFQVSFTEQEIMDNMPPRTTQQGESCFCAGEPLDW